VAGSGNWLFNNVMGQGNGVLTLTKSGSGTITLTQLRGPAPNKSPAFAGSPSRDTLGR
jgi:hypothetical protein